MIKVDYTKSLKCNICLSDFTVTCIAEEQVNIRLHNVISEKTVWPQQ